MLIVGPGARAVVPGWLSRFASVREAVSESQCAPRMVPGAGRGYFFCVQASGVEWQHHCVKKESVQKRPSRRSTAGAPAAGTEAAAPMTPPATPTPLELKGGWDGMVADAFWVAPAIGRAAWSSGSNAAPTTLASPGVVAFAVTRAAVGSTCSSHRIVCCATAHACYGQTRCCTHATARNRPTRPPDT